MKSLREALVHKHMDHEKLNKATDQYWLLMHYFDEYSWADNHAEEYGESVFNGYAPIEKKIKLNAEDKDDAREKAQKEIDKLYKKDQNWFAGDLCYGLNADDAENIETMFASHYNGPY